MDAAATPFNDGKSDTAHYYLDERAWNRYGLKLLDDGLHEKALEALKLCTLLFPYSWNTYDPYGKALYLSGKKAGSPHPIPKIRHPTRGQCAGQKMIERLMKE